MEQRLLDLAEYAETSPLNRIEMGDPRVGIVTSGAAYGYAREAFPRASFLKLGLTYPLPGKLIAEFRAKVEQAVRGRGTRPVPRGEHPAAWGSRSTAARTSLRCCGELDPGLVARAARRRPACPGVDAGTAGRVPTPASDDLPDRPPTLCPGCSHRGVFVVLRKLGSS